MCLGTIVSGHNRIWAQSCLGTIVSGHNRVWAQSCLGTIVSGHNRVWAQSCLGTIISGHSRVGPIMYGHKRGGTLYIRIATVGNTIQTVNSPMYDTYMSSPGNTAKLGATNSNIQTTQRGPSLVGSEPTMH